MKTQVLPILKKILLFISDPALVLVASHCMSSNVFR